MLRNSDWKVVIRPEVFREEYIPTILFCREGQLKKMEGCFSTLLNKDKPVNIWLYGKPGSGKTHTALYFINKLKERQRIRSVYLSCWQYRSFYSILEAILRELRVLCTEERNQAIKFEILKRHIREIPVILILDEIEFLPLKERSKALFHLNQIDKIGLICISRSRKAWVELDSLVQSRLNAVLIGLDSYSEAELLEILKQRAEDGLVPKSFSLKILKEIAHLTGGDARIAIQTLRNSAYLAESEHEGIIRKKHISNCLNEMKDLKQNYLLRSLSVHHQIIYQIIRDAYEIQVSALHKLYLKRCNVISVEPMAKRTFDHYLLQMVRMNLLSRKRASGRGRHFIYLLASQNEKGR